MDLKQLFTDDRAVSPVIGVILMVAITVILAAVIGTFVLGIGQDQQTTPQPVLDFTWDGANLTVTHEGGDTINSENTGQTGDCSSADADGLGLSVNGDSLVDAYGATAADACWNTDISAGQNFELFDGTIAGASGDVDHGGSLGGGDKVRVIWQAPGGGSTQTLASFKVPE